MKGFGALHPMLAQRVFGVLNYMTSLLHGIDRFFDLFFRLMKPLPALAVLMVFAILTAAFSLVTVRWTSNQKAIRKIKDSIGAHVLEVRLFSDQPRVVLRAYVGLLRSLCGYLLCALPSALVLTLPLLLIFGQLEDRFENSPVTPRLDFLVSASLGSEDSLPDVALRLPPDLYQTAPAVRMAHEREIDWRIQAKRSGVFDIYLVLQGEEVSKRVVVGSDASSIAPRRGVGNVLQQIMSPSEPPLPHGGWVQQIQIQYPARRFDVGPWSLGWIAPYIVLTIIAALLLRKTLHAEI